MKELKSKKTNRVSILTEEEYASMVNKGVISMKLFTVTSISSRPIIPPLKSKPVEIKQIEIKPVEIKKTKKKNI